MEGIVAKRTLKKSYYENKNINNSVFEGISFNANKEINKKEKSKFETLRAKWIYKICIQSITMISIIVFILAIKFLNINVITESRITQSIIKQYQKTYSVSQIIDGSKTFTKMCYTFFKPILPKNIENKLKDVYKILFINENNESINEKINNEDEVKIYEESSIDNKENKSKENVGVGVIDEEEKIVAVSSSISSEANIVDEIKETKIDFVKPVSGKITSHFGAREVIFEGIDSYHTGTDIAASTGTKVVSSISGKVTRATYNKYNGNFIEVTNGKVATIYCHLSKLSVKVGESVKKGEKIGEVGSTGLSTGPHLHFEIVYNGTKVDPEQILEL